MDSNQHLPGFIAGFVAAVVTTLALFSPAPVDGADEAPVDLPRAVCTIGDIKEQLRQVDATVFCFHITYESLPKLSELRLHRYTRREIAVEAPNLFLHKSAKNTEVFSVDEDPFQQVLTFSGADGILAQPVNRTFERMALEDHAQLPGSVPRDVLFPVLAWWPSSSIAPPQIIPGSPLCWPDVVASDRYRVLPKLQNVNGTWCHVIENPGLDRVWLDVSRGPRLVAREIIDPDTSAVVQRLDAWNHREVLPKIWVPLSFRSRRYNRFGTQLEGDSEMAVKDVSVNSPLGRDAYQYAPPPGVLEVVGDRWAQSTPRGFEQLDQMSRLARRPQVMAGSSGGLSRLGLDSAWATDTLLTGSAVVVVVWFCRHGWRRRKEER